MTLNSLQNERLAELAGRQNMWGLSPVEEKEMRALMAKEFPNEAATLAIGALALVAMGFLAYYLLKDT